MFFHKQIWILNNTMQVTVGNTSCRMAYYNLYTIFAYDFVRFQLIFQYTYTYENKI